MMGAHTDAKRKMEIACYARSNSLAAAEKKYGVSKNTIKYWKAQCGLTGRAKKDYTPAMKMIESGKSINATAKEFGVSFSVMRREWKEHTRVMERGIPKSLLVGLSLGWSNHAARR